MSTLEIKDLQVSVATDDGAKEILKGVTLTIKDGETHAIMGPNGSGKSTLAYSVAGHPKYDVTGGTVTFDGEDVLAMSVDERARAGLFLAMQYPVEVPGVSVSNFLRTAKTALDGEAPKLRTWVKDVNAALEQLNLDPTFGTRNVNEGFSGGEKKRHEIAQLELLNPKMAILDETDSGLDIDALKIVSEGVNRFRAQEGKGVLLITHYTRILRYIEPDFVHVFVDGKIAEQGGPELADALEAEGYDKYLRADGLTMSDAAGPPPRAGGHPQGLPDPRAHAREREAAGLPRQRQHLAEAPGRHRRDGRPPRAAQRQHRPGDAPARRGVDGGLRGGPGQGGGVPRRAVAQRGRLHQERDRGAQPAGPHHRPRPRRQRRHHRDGAPLQHRVVAAGLRAGRRRAALVRPDRRRAARPVERRPAGRRAHQGRGLHLGLQHARDDQPGHRPRGPREGGRRLLGHRRLAGRPAAPGRRRRHRAATSWSSPATRPSARPGSACSGDARSCSTSSRPSTAAAR